MVSSQVDPELCFRHQHGVLQAILSKHVDDLKITGTPSVIQHILSELQKIFGELKIEWNVFTNCGVRHIQDIRTKEITLDQIEYAKNMRSISHPQLHGGKPEDLCNPELHSLYRSLLGAVAYLSHTRVDIVVFVCAAQRYASKPQIQHVRRLNKLLGWIQRNPRRLVYKNLSSGLRGETRSAMNRETMQSRPHTHLRVLSDAAYKKETDDGYSLRGALYCRCSGNSRQSF